MKYILVALIVLLSSFQITPNYILEIDDLNKKSGKYITAEGELKVLVVFAKFKDDTSSHPFWPVDGYPYEMNYFIDQDSSIQSNHYLNLTNYYNQMSLGKLKVLGKAIGVETPLPKIDYLLLNKTCLNRAKANTDILKSIDDSIDYSEFDNWTYLSNYEHLNQPDGIVDMIIVIWRGLIFSNQWSGESSLGYGSDFFVENNSKKIRMGYYYFSNDNQIFGSGVTIQYWGERTEARNFKNCIHELAHWFIQAEHPYEKYNHSFWGMLTLGCDGICVNAIEREKLGWINPTAIESSLTKDMGDFITTGNSYKYHFYINDIDEYYYFENHQKKSIYDDATVNEDDKGIFVLHLKNSYYKGDCVRIIPSDGFWDWAVVGSTNCWGNELPVFKKVSQNSSGYSHRDRIIINNQDHGFLYCYQDGNNLVECNSFLHGHNFRSSYDICFHKKFILEINSCSGSSVYEKYIMEVMSQDDNRTIVNFIFPQITTVESISSLAEINFILHQNYPNPFNPCTNISYQIPASLNPSQGGTLVTLKVYDILGNEVATLVDDYREAGMYEVEFQSTVHGLQSGVGSHQLASGIYLYRLEAGAYVETKKMILLK